YFVNTHGIPSFWTTLKKEASTAKSPQAGHQVGLSALSCFFVSFSAGVAEVVSDMIKVGLRLGEIF
ncbi:hypothetical protein OAK41_03815, partial [Akkermansiaceae bacterium]|nr:hypothetical protein [Akkermansiaceae bacterium]